MPISSTGSAIATPVESSKSAVAWGPILGGAVAAIGISLILILFGSGLGLTMISPWSGESSSAATVGISAAIWLVVVQWLSAALGGYLTGRLRTKWAAVHTDEVFFRDTAHGFVSWAVATVFVAGFLASSLGSLAGAGAQAVGSAAATAGVAGSAAAAASSDNSSSGGTSMATSYFTDALLRRSRPRPAPRTTMRRQPRKCRVFCSTVQSRAACRKTTRLTWQPSSRLAPAFRRRTPALGSMRS